MDINFTGKNRDRGIDMMNLVVQIRQHLEQVRRLFPEQDSMLETASILRSMYLELINEGIDWPIERSVNYLGEMVKIQKNIKA